MDQQLRNLKNLTGAGTRGHMIRIVHRDSVYYLLVEGIHAQYIDRLTSFKDIGPILIAVDNYAIHVYFSLNSYYG